MEICIDLSFMSMSSQLIYVLLVMFTATCFLHPVVQGFACCDYLFYKESAKKLLGLHNNTIVCSKSVEITKIGRRTVW